MCNNVSNLTYIHKWLVVILIKQITLLFVKLALFPVVFKFWHAWNNCPHLSCIFALSYIFARQLTFVSLNFAVFLLAFKMAFNGVFV